MKRGKQTERPLVSVCMSAYNAEKTVAEAIESVLSQNYDNIEFIIIDDASTDRTAEIIKGYTDKRISYCRLDRNRHMCFAFNEALARAGGKYIAHMDADDVWYPSKISEQVRVMEDDPALGACFCLADFIDEHGRRTEGWSGFDVANRSRGQWLRLLFNGNRLMHPSALYRSDVIDEVGPYSYKHLHLQDFDLWIRILKRYPIHLMDKRLFSYREFSDGSNSSAWTLKRVIRRYSEFLEIIYDMFRDLSDELFEEGFSDLFIYKGVHSRFDYECEKAFILLNGRVCRKDNKILGIRKLRELINTREDVLTLEEHFNFTLRDYYSLCETETYYPYPDEAPVY